MNGTQKRFRDAVNLLLGLGVLIALGIIFSPLARLLDPRLTPTITPTPYDLVFGEVSKAYKNLHCHEQEVVGLRIGIAGPRGAVRGGMGVEVSINDYIAGIGLGHLTYYMGSTWLPASYFENDEAIVIEIDPRNEYAESNETNNRMVIPMGEFNARPILYTNSDC